MTDEEYSKAIYNILASGRGYKALTDIVGSLAILNDNMLCSIREIKSERNAIRKICDGPTSNKDKVKTILTIVS